MEKLRKIVTDKLLCKICYFVNRESDKSDSRVLPSHFLFLILIFCLHSSDSADFLSPGHRQAALPGPYLHFKWIQLLIAVRTFSHNLHSYPGTAAGIFNLHLKLLECGDLFFSE